MWNLLKSEWLKLRRCQEPAHIRAENFERTEIHRPRNKSRSFGRKRQNERFAVVCALPVIHRRPRAFTHRSQAESPSLRRAIHPRLS